MIQPKKISNFTLPIIALLTGLLVWGLQQINNPALAQTSPPAQGIFTPATIRSTLPVPSQVIRARTVTADFTQLNQSETGTIAQQVGSAHLPLNLFDDLLITAELDVLNHNHLGTVSWIGHVVGQPESDVILVRKGEVMVGLITVGNQIYEIRYGGNGTQLILEVDQSKFIDHPADWQAFIDNDTAEQEAIAQQSETRGTTIAADDGSVLDIMVGYTSAASTAAGGQAAIESTAQLSVDLTNIAYENSAISQRVALVHTQLFTYTESGNTSTDVIRWRTLNDNHMDEAHTARDTHHADLMMLIVEYADPSAPNVGCGVAYFQSSIDASFENRAFGLTVRSCAISNLTFPHEIGHNLGLNHDWYLDNDTNPETYAHGYPHPAGRWRTIMAYNHYCTASAGITCTRIPHFSNPNVAYQGAPTGVPSNTASNCLSGETTPDPTSCDAHAEKLLDDNNPVYAAWRTSQITWIGNSTDWHDPANWIIPLGASGSTSNTNRAPLTIDDVYIPAGVSNFPVISSGIATARNLVLEDGASLTMNGGILEIYGNWEEKGTSGATASSAGLIKWVGTLEQTITARSASTFPAMQVGNGNNSSQVTLLTDLDINGNFTILSGGRVTAGNNTLKLSGSWDDQAGQFLPQASTVVFDGSAQSISATTSHTILTEDFSAYDSSCCANSDAPGWGDEDLSGGSAFLTGNGTTYHGTDSNSAWLYTPALLLNSDTVYSFSLDTLKSSMSGTSTITIAYGATPYSPNMTTIIDTIDNNDISTTFQSNMATFTVPTAGLYYIGIHSTKTSSYNRLDNISLTGQKTPTFYTLQIASGTTTLQTPIAINHIFQIDAGTTAALNNHTVTVESSVTNSGTLQQTKAVTNGLATQFVYIRNKVGDQIQYAGIDLTPTSGNMGSTLVKIKGNQSCVSNNLPTSRISRCYEIAPTVAQTAITRFYYSAAENNGSNQPTIYRETSSGSDSWETEVAPNHGGSGTAVWAEAIGINQYGTFMLGDEQIKIYLPLLSHTP